MVCLTIRIEIPGKELSLQLAACLRLLLEISFSFVISSFFLKFLVSSLANEKFRILFFCWLKDAEGQKYERSGVLVLIHRTQLFLP